MKSKREMSLSSKLNKAHKLLKILFLRLKAIIRKFKEIKRDEKVC